MTDSAQPTESCTTVHRFMPEMPEYDRTGTVFEVEMPEGAQILNFTPLGFYALVVIPAPLVTRRFFMVSTGEPIERPDLLRYISTPAQGRHLFEIIESAN